MNTILNHLTSSSLLKWFWLTSFVICASSWLHLYNTQSIAVDGHSIQPVFLRLAVFLLIAISWTKLCLEIYFLFQRQDLLIEPLILRVNIYFAILLQSITLPLFSNDIFSVLAYSQAHIMGQDIYNSFNAAQTDFGKYVNPMYMKMPCMYGPFSVLQNCIPFYFKFDSIYLNIIVSKIILAVNAIVYAEVCIKIIKSLQTPYRYLILIFPLWLIQGLGQMHNDLLGMTWLALGIFAMIRGKILWTALFICLAILVKITFGFFILIPLFYWYHHSEMCLKKSSLFLGMFSLIFLFIGTLFYWPFNIGVLLIFKPLEALNLLRPSSSLSDLLSYGLLLIQSNLELNAIFTNKFCKLFGIIICIIAIVKYYNSSRNFQNSINLLLILFSTMLLIVSHRFLPWYLMSFPFIFIFKQNKNSWFLWLVFITWISFFQDLAIMIDTEWLGGKILMIISTVCTVLLYFYKFGKRFSFE